MSFDPRTYRKRMPVAKLIELLQSLPLGLSVECNEIKNLALTDDDDRFIGFVDMGGKPGDEHVYLQS
jgi:hypothetical protein